MDAEVFLVVNLKVRDKKSLASTACLIPLKFQQTQRSKRKHHIGFIHSDKTSDKDGSMKLATENFSWEERYGQCWGCDPE